jgi:putative DNA primase/helicase
MFLLCSISTALKQGADASRFAQLTLRNPSFMPLEQRQAHWTELDRDLTAIVTPTLGHRMALRSVAQIPVIRDSVAAFRRAAANRFDSQRQADQYGTLLAGAWSLMNTHVATEADAYQLIDANDWSEYREATEQSDEERCLARILQHQLRVEGDRATYQRTAWELIELVRGTATSIEITAGVAEAHLGRIGLRVMDGRLLVANTALGLQRILADTQWAHSWATVLSRLPGAQKPGKVRFRGMERNSRAVSLPLDLS